MSVTSSRLLDGLIAGLLLAVILSMKDLMVYQEVNWFLTTILAASAFVLCSVVLPLFRKQPNRSRRRVAK